MSKMILKLIATGVLTAAVAPVMADQASCSTAGCTTAALPVNFSITIPAVLRLQVGAVGTNASVAWNTAVTAANLGNGTALNADTVTNGGAGAGLVAYALMGNLGNATITATGAGTGFAGTALPANTIPYTAVSATPVAIIGAPVTLPVPGAPTVVNAVSGVIQQTGTWQYTYANSTVYPADTYTGTINYTVSQAP